MDPDRQPSPIGSEPSTALASLVQEPDEEPDSPMADGGFAACDPLPATLSFDLVGPLLGRLIALLAIAVPMLSVLADRRPEPVQSPTVLPATLSRGAEPTLLQGHRR